jgi:NAD(P)-dependent dehydrogenase (short-subunit alcohol dehydrogenase family)
MLEKFKINGQVVVITGGAGLMGMKHAEAIAEIGGIPVLFDIDEKITKNKAEEIGNKYDVDCIPFIGDVSNEDDIIKLKDNLINQFGRIDVLINNAALNPQVNSDVANFSRLENYNLEIWDKEIAVGLTGAFLCSKVFGPDMAKKKSGVIINISSDLGIIAPDQRIYRKDRVGELEQPVKPISYSVIKHGIIGLTKYLATYWAHEGVRTNALCPGGIEQDQDSAFIQKLTNLIPLGRMAKPDEYKSTIQFLCSDASSYMNGSILVVDGGRCVL